MRANQATVLMFLSLEALRYFLKILDSLYLSYPLSRVVKGTSLTKTLCLTKP